MILDSKDHPEWEVPQKDVQKSGKYRKMGVCFVRREKLWHFFFLQKGETCFMFGGSGASL